MSLFGGFIGKLFGTDKATDKIIDTVSSGIDKIWYTSEEKAEDAADARREGQAFLIEWLKSTSGSRLARRLIALIIVSIWAIQFLSVQILMIIAVWSENAQPFKDSAQVISDNIDQSTGATMLILAFYFAAPHMEPIVKGALEKFGKVNQVEK